MSSAVPQFSCLTCQREDEIKEPGVCVCVLVCVWLGGEVRGQGKIGNLLNVHKVDIALTLSERGGGGRDLTSIDAAA